MRAFFFFQAEDGIRDADVAGVQTCALPISPIRRNSRDGAESWPGPIHEVGSQSRRAAHSGLRESALSSALPESACPLCVTTVRTLRRSFRRHEEVRRF